MNECHYQDGNYKAKARFEIIRLLLEDAGIDPDRIALEWVSGAEAPRFAEKVTQFTQTIKALGPNLFGKKEVETCR